MTLQSNLLIQHIENLLTICQATLGSEDAKQLQQQHLQFQHVDANELLLLEITRALTERIADDTIMSYFRMLLRYALIENKSNLNCFMSAGTIELLGASA